MLFFTVAGCTSAVVPHMKVPPCVCTDWAVRIQLDQPQMPHFPLWKPSMIPANRSENNLVQKWWAYITAYNAMLVLILSVNINARCLHYITIVGIIMWAVLSTLGQHKKKKISILLQTHNYSHLIKKVQPRLLLWCCVSKYNKIIYYLLEIS